MHRIKSIVAAVCVLALIAGMYYVSTWETFDAKKYGQAVLDENFKGDVSAAAIMIKDQTAEELQEHYETGIENFLYMYLLNVPTPLQNLPQIALDSILKYDLIDCRA